MQYMAENFADYGFSFLEKLHTPIFLISKSGVIQKINEAGRKLAAVGQISKVEMTQVAQSVVESAKGARRISLQHVTCKNKQVRLIANRLGSSDFYLVELLR